MRYFFINTDVDALGYSPHATWIKHNHAFTSGDSHDSSGYKRFGERSLGRLKLGNVLFMYANKLGVVAAGEVTEPWGHERFMGTDRLVYRRCRAELEEYRIPVDWYLSIVNNPISKEDLEKCYKIKPTPHPVRFIKNEDIAVQLLEGIMKRTITKEKFQ